MVSSDHISPPNSSTNILQSYGGGYGGGGGGYGGGGGGGYGGGGGGYGGGGGGYGKHLLSKICMSNWL